MIEILKRVILLGSSGLRNAFRLGKHLLLFLLIFQMLLLWLIFQEQQVPIPDFVKRKASEFLSHHKLKGNAAQAELYLNGHIHFKHLELGLTQFNDSLIKCEEVDLDLSLFSLLFGNLKAKDLVVKNGSLSCPPTFSPTGISEPLAKNIYIAINDTGRQLEIQQVSFDIFNTQIIAEGSLLKESLTENSNPSDINHWLKQMGRLLEKETYFNAFNDPMLSIHIEQDGRHSALECQLQFKQFKWKDRGSAESGLLAANLALENGSLTLNGPLGIQVKNFEWDKKYHMDWGHGLLEVHYKDNIEYGALELVAQNGIIHNLPLGMLGIKADLQQYPDIRPELEIVSDDGEWVVGKINHTDEQQIQGHITGSIDVDTLLKWVPVTLQESDAFPDLSGNVHLNVNTTMSKGERIVDLALENVEGVLQTDNLKIDSRDYNSVYFDFIKNSDQFIVKNGYVSDNYNKAIGEYSLDLETGAYRYELEGSIEPGVADIWLGDWWDQLWTKINLNNKLPYADIEIVKKHPEDPPRVYLDVVAEDFKYNDVDIEKCMMRISSTKDHLELSDLTASSKEKSLSAYLKWIYEENEREASKLYISGNSTYELGEVNAIIDDSNVYDIIQHFASEEGPEISLVGVKDKQPWRSWFDIHFATNKRVEYHGMPLDHLSFDAQYTLKSTILSNITLGFAQGSGSGNALIENNDQLSFDFSASNMNQDLTIAYLKHFMGQGSGIVENNYHGKVDLNVTAQGTIGDTSTFTGNGGIRVSEADLGKINLFGLVSEILSITPLGIGSFQLTDASSTFTIQNDYINFPDAVIWGPSASIQSKGNMKLSTQELNFLMDISPMNKRGKPLLSQALLILAPITQSFQVNIKGTLSNPDVQTSLTPFGFFKSKAPKSSE